MQLQQHWLVNVAQLAFNIPLRISLWTKGSNFLPFSPPPPPNTKLCLGKVKKLSWTITSMTGHFFQLSKGQYNVISKIWHYGIFPVSKMRGTKHVTEFMTETRKDSWDGLYNCSPTSLTFPATVLMAVFNKPHVVDIAKRKKKTDTKWL